MPGTTPTRHRRKARCELRRAEALCEQERCEVFERLRAHLPRSATCSPGVSWR